MAHAQTVITVLFALAVLTSCDRPAEQEADRGGTGAGAESETTADAPAPSEPSIGPGDAVRTVVVADEGTAGAQGWPDQLAATLEAIGIPMSVTTTAPRGAGFLTEPRFPDLVAGSAQGSTQLVVLFDSDLRDADPAALSTAVEDAFEAVERAAPDAVTLVIGPLTAGDDAVTAALQNATAEGGGTLVDPFEAGWPADPTQAQIADLLRVDVQPIAEVLAASGANR